MRIGVFLEQNLKVGGGFRQAFSVVELLQKNPMKDIEYVFFVFTRENQQILQGVGVDSVYIGFSIRRFLHRVCSKFFREVFGLLLPFRGFIDGILDRHNIDLVYFLGPSPYAMGLSRHHYVITIWDQCHRDWVEFPEVYMNLEFERREFLYRNIMTRATAILVDSELSKKNAHERYGIDLARLHVAPFFPVINEGSKDKDVCEKYSIQTPFLFYPAQLWPHKNHVLIIEALNRLKSQGILINAVFVGNDYGNEAYLRRFVQEKALDSQVHFLGFIPRDELESFYKQALTFVMPTYFGPTNIPPLEAFAFGCPVCYSNLPGLQGQVGDGAWGVDVYDPDSLCEAIKVILHDKGEVMKKVTAGTDLLKIYNGDHYLDVLCNIFTSYRKILRTYSIL